LQIIPAIRNNNSVNTRLRVCDSHLRILAVRDQEKQSPIGCCASPTERDLAKIWRVDGGNWSYHCHWGWDV